MFTNIHLENYRTFSNLTVDLTQKGGSPKNLFLLYGENGAGKSNFATAFLTLSETVRTMDIRDFLQEFMAKNKQYAENENFLKMMRLRFRDIEAIIQDAKTIGAEGNLVLDFTFLIGGKSGKYRIEMAESEIVLERLEYTLEKNRGIYFDITPNNAKLNDKAFIDKSFIADVRENIEKFWGKHSLLSILNYETKDKTKNYLDNAISKQFRMVLQDFLKLSCKVKCGDAPERGIIGLTHPILKDLESGEIRSDRTEELDQAEAMLNSFLPKINRNVRNVYYRREAKEKDVYYELYTKQMIAGALRDVPFRLESTGTQFILELLPFFLAAAKGGTVVIDELDTGIHDLMVCDILLAIHPDIRGQLIITTHNTLLMESKLPASAFYVIVKDEDGNRLIQCITEFNERIQTNHNIRDKYLYKKAYKAVPENTHISLVELLNELDHKTPHSM